MNSSDKIIFLIMFYDFTLQGKIPPWIGNFEYLMELNLFNNNFDGIALWYIANE